MIEARFPVEISRNATGGDGFLVQVSVVESGQEQRISKRTIALGSWTISFNHRDKAMFQSLRNFFLAVKGRLTAFRFKDWLDYESDIQQNCSPATGTGALTAFQLQKTYTVTSPLVAYVRTITKPVAGTVRVFVNGAEVFSPASWSVNTATGVLTFVSPPANGHTVKATYEFDKVVRFDSDVRESAIIHKDLFTWDQITLVEVPEL